MYYNQGIYTASLVVTNDFGEDSEIKTNYITVTSTPVPWVLFSANTTIACRMDTIVFTDETLYDPTSWTWEFQPSTVTFTDGTSLNSQNPHVRFEAPGYYTVTLTASNENGSNFRTYNDMIFIQGIMLNFSEDFESGKSNFFDLSIIQGRRLMSFQELQNPDHHMAFISREATSPADGRADPLIQHRIRPGTQTLISMDLPKTAVSMQPVSQESDLPSISGKHSPSGINTRGSG